MRAAFGAAERFHAISSIRRSNEKPFMSKAKTPGYELSDAEKRDLTQLIQAGKPLPEKYRFILFEDKREVELVWNGKTNDICNIVLPFQAIEQIDEPRTDTDINIQKSLHDFGMDG